MIVSPLLSQPLVERVSLLLQQKGTKEKIIEVLEKLPREEKIHVLRFLYIHSSTENISCLYEVWGTYIPSTHVLNTKEHCRALHEIGSWWDTYRRAEDLSVKQYDELEAQLDALGNTAEGHEYFRWVALFPVSLYMPGSAQTRIWDEHRRGSIVCLAKYAYSRETERFLARHLDDWNTIGLEVLEILAAMKSRLLPKLAPWYVKHDSLLKPLLKVYEFESLSDENDTRGTVI